MKIHTIPYSLFWTWLFGKDLLDYPGMGPMGLIWLTVKKTGTVNRVTEFGDMSFPILSGWPNQGVGRINLDGSKGALPACHPRHRFDMAMARKPYTCSQ